MQFLFQSESECKNQLEVFNWFDVRFTEKLCKHSLEQNWSFPYYFMWLLYRLFWSYYQKSEMKKWQFQRTIWMINDLKLVILVVFDDVWILWLPYQQQLNWNSHKLKLMIWKLEMNNIKKHFRNRFASTIKWKVTDFTKNFVNNTSSRSKSEKLLQKI